MTRSKPIHNVDKSKLPLIRILGYAKNSLVGKQEMVQAKGRLWNIEENSSKIERLIEKHLEIKSTETNALHH